MSSPTLNGLVLAGGRSERMHADKGLLLYNGVPRREYCRTILTPFCRDVYLSCRRGQPFPPSGDVLIDELENCGPAAGILSAFRLSPGSAWLVMACDLLRVTPGIVGELVSRRNALKDATAYFDGSSERPEPFLTIWEPTAGAALAEAVLHGDLSPSRLLARLDCELIEPADPHFLKSANTPEEREESLHPCEPSGEESSH